MPHISVKMFAGRDGETKRALAQALQRDVAQILGQGSEHVSVSIQDVDLDGWGEVYDSEIRENPHILIPASYDWDAEYLRMTGRPRGGKTG